MNYSNVVYISHPFGDDVDNIMNVTNLISMLHHEYPTYLFLSPIHAFGHMYAYTEYQEGLNMCLWLLDRSDEMWVFGDYLNSVGCMSEIAYCKNHLIPYQIMSEKCLNIQTNNFNVCNECGLVDYDEYCIMCKKEFINNAYEKSAYERKRKETSF